MGTITAIILSIIWMVALIAWVHYNSRTIFLPIWIKILLGLALLIMVFVTALNAFQCWNYGIN